MWLSQILQLQRYPMRAAAVGHGGMEAAGEHIGQAAVQAGRAVWPADFSKRPFQRVDVGQHLDQFGKGDALPCDTLLRNWEEGQSASPRVRNGK